MHEKFGFLDFEEVLKGAENYARNGFPVHEVEAKSWQEKEHRLKQNNNSSKIFLNNNRSYKFMKYLKIFLCEYINTISKKKIDGFYNSDITKDMVETLNELGGLHTEDDFLSQKTIFSSTLTNYYKNLKIHQCLLNGPGIIVLLMMALNEMLDTSQYHHSSFERYHLQAEITMFV